MSVHVRITKEARDEARKLSKILGIPMTNVVELAVKAMGNAWKNHKTYTPPKEMPF